MRELVKGEVAQAILGMPKDKAPDLEAVAWAEDGVIEGAEHRRHAWCIRVQWHPEMQYGEAPQGRLFAALVDAI